MARPFKIKPEQLELIETLNTLRNLPKIRSKIARKTAMETARRFRWNRQLDKAEISKEWAPIVDGYYATTEGQIYSIKSGKLISMRETKRGYLEVALSVNGIANTYLAHRIICAAFHGPQPSSVSVNHKNYVKTDNRPENLEWMDTKENHRRAVLDGRIRSGCNHYASKLSAEDIKTIRELVTAGKSQAYIGRVVGVHQAVISRVVNGKTYK